MAYENGVSFRAVIMAKPQGERGRGRAGRVACGAGKKERLNLTPKQVIVNALPSVAEKGDERRASDDLHADEIRHALGAALRRI